jgi:hypothetical protein
MRHKGKGRGSPPAAMRVRYPGFGELEIDGQRYDRDVILDRGRVRRRHKGPSRGLRDRHGHTPLTAAEEIPWSCRRLIIGTGAVGALPIDASVHREAARRGIEIVALPTAEACALISGADRGDVAAVLHLTC